MTQPEQVLEDNLVSQLVKLGYERVAVLDEFSLLANLKTQLEAFNEVVLTEEEFEKVLNHLTRSTAVFEKAKVLRDRMALQRENGDTVYLDFLDAVDFSRNRFQVTQLVSMEGSYKNRYDLTSRKCYSVRSILGIHQIIPTILNAVGSAFTSQPINSLVAV